MFDLTLKTYENNTLAIQADPKTNCKLFVWKAYNDNQTFEVISTTNNNILIIKEADKFLKKYTKVVCYASDDTDTYISSYLNLGIINVQNMNIFCIKSYKGYALFFDHQILTGTKHPVCEEYRIFGIKENKTRCIAKANTFMYYLSNLNYEKYYVEGYKNKKINNIDTHILCYRSRQISADELLSYANSKLGTYDEKEMVNADLTICIAITKENENLKRQIDSAIATKDCNTAIVIASNIESAPTYKLCKWYTDNYPNIVYKDIFNTHLGDFKNNIIEFATSISHAEYITFIEENEFVHFAAYKKMLTQAKYWNKDIVFAKYIKYNPNENNFDIKSDISDYIDNNKPHLEFIQAETQRITNWHRIIKTNIMTNAKYPNHTEYPNDVPPNREDLAQTIVALGLTNSFAICNDAFYGSYFEPKEIKTERNTENVLFVTLVYPIHCLLKSKEKNIDINMALAFVLKRFAKISLPQILNDNTDDIEASKISLILKHITKNTAISKNYSYTNDIILCNTIKNVIERGKNPDTKVFSWIINNEYLAINLK